MRIGLVITNARAEAPDVEAADRLALARLDDDGAPYPSLLRSEHCRPNPHSGRGRAAGHARQQLTPALMGVG